MGNARLRARPLEPPPTVETNGASSVQQTSATLNATVNPNGSEVSECRFEYGTTISYGSSAPCTPAPGSGTSPVAVSAALERLAENQTYHFRVVATGTGGSSADSDRTFKTLPKPPTALSEQASTVTHTSATLKASVNPNGGEVSKCEFEYGTTTSYGSTVPCSSPPGSGERPVAVAASVSSLTANTLYHFRISATNAGGTGKGFDETFTTATPHYYANGALVGSGAVTVAEWGTITLKTTKGLVGTSATCHTAAAGSIANPEGGAAGEGLTEAFVGFDCEAEGICLAGQQATLAAQSLPWHDLLSEEVAGTIRQETGGTKLILKCLQGEKVESEVRFVTAPGEKGERPILRKGTSASHPGFLLFAEGSGELAWEGSAGVSAIEGSVKLIGYEEQELISVREQ